MNTWEVWIHCPAGTTRARAETYASTSAIVSMSGTSWSCSNIAAAGACTCESIRPGRTMRPPSSCTDVRPGAANARIRAEVPVATTRPSRTANASVIENRGSTVSTLPPTNTASGGGSAENTLANAKRNSGARRRGVLIGGTIVWERVNGEA